jgi:hypothetical protein
MKYLLSMCLLMACSMEEQKEKKVIDTKIRIKSDSSVYYIGNHFKRIKIDGIDCIVGSDVYAVALACNWSCEDK